MTMVYTHNHNYTEYKKFSDEMKSFKNKGGRNTSDMGRDLCDRVNILEFHLKEDVNLTDCEGVYE